MKHYSAEMKQTRKDNCKKEQTVSKQKCENHSKEKQGLLIRSTFGLNEKMSSLFPRLVCRVQGPFLLDQTGFKMTGRVTENIFVALHVKTEMGGGNHIHAT